MSFYSARLLYIILVDDGRPRRRQHCDETVIVFRARDYEHAFDRALALGRLREDAYRNHLRQRVRWALVEVLTVDYVGPAMDGAEVASIVGYRTFPKPVSARARFHPERSKPETSAPAGSLRRRHKAERPERAV